ncbi:DUF6146 family protein [Lacinutrix neustonica]|uniref:DUF6146 family protein n=1 Tax=Lacinutrix neustonica TaxID=2980107 RepID=A0A9E8SE29_9FLAO|nr:DUF6146 family protein [Lacinutrix neustonica]WAC02357.1 DUF6146 family protein [Lacinutrix neustonica]
MKNLILAACILTIAFGCHSAKDTAEQNPIEKPEAQVGDTLKISSDKLEYDIIIIEPGFNTWLTSMAKPKEFYTQSYLEDKNSRYVQAWNSAVLQPTRFNSNLYELQINYKDDIDYGYDVNYKLFNYFIYFQNTYNQNLLGGRVPQN